MFTLDLLLSHVNSNFNTTQENNITCELDIFSQIMLLGNVHLHMWMRISTCRKFGSSSHTVKGKPLTSYLSHLQVSFLNLRMRKNSLVDDTCCEMP